MEAAVFDDIVSGFYSAASGRIGWIDALLPFQQAVSAIAIHLLALDLDRGHFQFSYSASQQPAAELDYVTTYHLIDPRSQHTIAGAPGDWFNCWEHFSEDFVANDPFYQEYLLPYGGRYVSATKLSQEGSVVELLGIHRGLGSEHLDAAELAVCGRLARHLASALKVQRSLERQPARSLLGVELLERLRAPILLVDERRRLLHANP